MPKIVQGSNGESGVDGKVSEVFPLSFGVIGVASAEAFGSTGVASVVGNGERASTGRRNLAERNTESLCGSVQPGSVNDAVCRDADLSGDDVMLPFGRTRGQARGADKFVCVRPALSAILQGESRNPALSDTIGLPPDKLGNVVKRCSDATMVGAGP